MARRVFISVAEVSGDQHAAHLIQSLKQLDPDIIVEGHGGPAMKAAGAKIHRETVGRAVMGLQAFLRVFEMQKLLKWTRTYYRKYQPDLQICIDSPALNFHIAKAATEQGIPVLYYIAPQLWAWREGRMKKLRKWVDHVACVLPFEEEYFRRHGVNATFVGHPLFDELPAGRGITNGPRFPDRPPAIGLLAGSRRSEAEANFPHILEVAQRIREVFKDAKFVSPTTPATQPVVRKMFEERGMMPPQFIESAGVFDEMVQQCDLCITVSGTATLHVAGFGVPMIVVYRSSPLVWHLLGRWIIKTRTYSLVNLLADSREHIVPEFIPWYGSNDPVADRAIDYLQNPQKLVAQQERLAQLIRSLDKPGASMNAAKIAIEMMNSK
jgi:lipid-A-disaccharide synthase